MVVSKELLTDKLLAQKTVVMKDETWVHVLVEKKEAVLVLSMERKSDFLLVVMWESNSVD
jgi:hypothetical protein